MYFVKKLDIYYTKNFFSLFFSFEVFEKAALRKQNYTEI